MNVINEISRIKKTWIRQRMESMYDGDVKITLTDVGDATCSLDVVVTERRTCTSTCSSENYGTIQSTIIDGSGNN